jgi:hypothetical protein
VQQAKSGFLIKVIDGSYLVATSDLSEGLVLTQLKLLDIDRFGVWSPNGGTKTYLRLN